jgi:hypothetical protein
LRGDEVKGVTSVKANKDGKIIIIYSGGGGMYKVNEVPPAFLQAWGIETNSAVIPSASQTNTSPKDDAPQKLNPDCAIYPHPGIRHTAFRYPYRMVDATYYDLSPLFRHYAGWVNAHLLDLAQMKQEVTVSHHSRPQYQTAESFAQAFGLHRGSTPSASKSPAISASYATLYQNQHPRPQEPSSWHELTLNVIQAVDDGVLAEVGVLSDNLYGLTPLISNIDPPVFLKVTLPDEVTTALSHNKTVSILALAKHSGTYTYTNTKQLICHVKAFDVGAPCDPGMVGNDGHAGVLTEVNVADFIISTTTGGW